MWINHTQIERRQEQIAISQGHEHGPIHRRISLIHNRRGLIRIPGPLFRNDERRIGEIQLRDPGNELWLPSLRRGHVTVIWTYGLAWLVPGKHDLFSREGEGFESIARYARSTTVAADIEIYTALVLRDFAVARVCDAVPDHFMFFSIVGREAIRVWLVDDMQGGEILPDQTRCVFGTGTDVRCQVGPSPGLRDTGFKPHWHGKQPQHLAERYLLPGFGCNGLREHLSDFAGVEVVDEAPDAGFAPARQFLVEVDEFTYSREGIVVRALGRSGWAEHVGE